LERQPRKKVGHRTKRKAIEGSNPWAKKGVATMHFYTIFQEGRRVSNGCMGRKTNACMPPGDTGESEKNLRMPGDTPPGPNPLGSERASYNLRRGRCLAPGGGGRVPKKAINEKDYLRKITWEKAQQSTKMYRRDPTRHPKPKKLDRTLAGRVNGSRQNQIAKVHEKARTRKKGQPNGQENGGPQGERLKSGGTWTEENVDTESNGPSAATRRTLRRWKKVVRFMAPKKKGGEGKGPNVQGSQHQAARETRKNPQQKRGRGIN